MQLQDEWSSLCNEHDAAWQGYIRALRSIRLKIDSKLKGLGDSPSLAEIAHEQRAWNRVRNVREKMDAYLRRHFETSDSRPRRVVR
jgi:hypothetical protein